MTITLTPVKVTSHPNIALLKYWGKSNIIENTPTNPSISLTLTKLTTTTEIMPNEVDQFILDGKPEQMPIRMKNLVEHFRNMAGYSGKLKITSTNSFPHSCGLASSASGYSALVKALDAFFRLNLTKKELSILARKGSGSASRSIYDGLVILKKEKEEYFSEKITDWHELKVLVLILNKEVKKVPSTEGMLRTVSTSELFKKRLENIDKKVQLMLNYINTRNFDKLVELTMRDSNEIHATCLDSFPPIFYLTDESKRVIDKVHSINKKCVKVGYTFDAGANAFLITKECFFDEIKEIFEKEYKVVEAL